MTADMMSFPDHWWEFVRQYQFADKEEVYTNGSMLIPSFRVQQMVMAYFDGPVDDNECELVETGSYSCAYEIIHVLECSACGKTCEHTNGSYPRCPHCGRKVVDQ